MGILDKVITTSEAAAMLGITNIRIRAMIRDGIVPKIYYRKTEIGNILIDKKWIESENERRKQKS